MENLHRWALCLFCAFLCASFGLGNWLTLLGTAVRREARPVSLCPPPLSLVMCVLACLACPWPGVWQWAWLLVVIDPVYILLVKVLALHTVARVVGWPSPFDGRPPRPPTA